MFISKLFLCRSHICFRQIKQTLMSIFCSIQIRQNIFGSLISTSVWKYTSILLTWPFPIVCEKFYFSYHTPNRPMNSNIMYLSNNHFETIIQLDKALVIIDPINQVLKIYSTDFRFCQRFTNSEVYGTPCISENLSQFYRTLRNSVRNNSFSYILFV